MNSDQLEILDSMLNNIERFSSDDVEKMIISLIVDAKIALDNYHWRNALHRIHEAAQLDEERMFAGKVH
jgi:hypothetical protein